ncbi:MAG: hypothetical protein IPL65_17200 [Lewinellaceae bacterium]|nr:hypothetical protein [Lewinellaceae bacterium]
MAEHKKASVKGVSYRVINVAMEGGDAAPSTPIGVNLPNSDWIREDYGSKSISLNNIEDAYGKRVALWLPQNLPMTLRKWNVQKKYSEACGKMHTALHEVIGHASRKLNPQYRCSPRYTQGVCQHPGGGTRRPGSVVLYARSQTGGVETHARWRSV